MSDPADTPKPDDDSPWKEAIGAYFQPFMQLFFADVHTLIAWHQPYEFLDAELQKIAGDAALGQCRADQLVRVRSREGQELWLLIHIEVQGKADASAVGCGEARTASPTARPAMRFVPHRILRVR